MMICKKCGNIASYNSYFGKYYCSVCGEYFLPKYKGSSEELIDKLREYGSTKLNGKMGDQCLVPKELLIAAADLLEHMKR